MTARAEEVHKIVLEADQRRAIATALTRQVSIISGGPGASARPRASACARDLAPWTAGLGPLPIPSAQTHVKRTVRWASNAESRPATS